MSVVLGIAKASAELHEVFRFRYALYVEDQQLFLDEADHEHRLLYDHYDTNSQIVTAHVDGCLAGTMRMTLGCEAAFGAASRAEYKMAHFQGLVDEARIATVSRFVLHKAFRGGAMSFQLLRKAFTYAAQHNIDLILGNCEPHLVRHYKALGFRPYGSLFNHPTNGLRIPIAIVCADFDYLKGIASPMLDCFETRPEPPRQVAHLARLIRESTALACECSHGKEGYAQLLADYIREPGFLMDSLKPLINGVSDIEILMENSQILTCSKGDVLIRQGQISRTVYILLSGTLEAVEDHGHTLIDRAGSLVGEVTFFTRQRRICDVIAGSDEVRVLALCDRTLNRLMDENPLCAAKFLHYVTQQLCQKLIGQSRSSDAAGLLASPFQLAVSKCGNERLEKVALSA